MGLDRGFPNMRKLLVNFSLNTVAISVYGLVMILDNLTSIIKDKVQVNTSLSLSKYCCDDL